MRCTGIALICALVVALPSLAEANGRFPATTNVHFQPGQSELLLLPATFGINLSTDGGETFRWICEESVGYGGTYDPDFSVAPNGHIYATTFQGLRVSRDAGCTWETIDDPFSNRWVGEVEVAADGRVWATTSTGGAPNDVYISSDGSKFNSVGLERADTWWLSIRISKSDPQRVYLSGYKPERKPPGGGDTLPAESLLMRSIDGGANWTDLGVSDFALLPESQIFLEAVSPTNPDLLFARVFRAATPLGDALYRSRDGGQTFTKILEMPSTMRAVLMRSDGKTLLAGSDNPCAGDPPEVLQGCYMIADNADADAPPNWTRPEKQPRIGCLGERSDGTLFACGANWEPDFFGLGTSTDGVNWQPVMRFEAIASPLSCPAETEQAKTCEKLRWPSICQQLNICTEAGGDAGPSTTESGGGGCQTAGAWSAAGALVLIIGLLILGLSRRRRPR